MSSRRIVFVVGRAGHVPPRVVRKLVQLARSMDAEVQLYHPAFEWCVLQKGGVGSVTSDSETRAMVEQRHVELDGVVETFAGAGVRATTVVTCEKPGYPGILRHVLEERPDLVVMQSTRHGSLARVLLSYTDFKLIERCPCPLLLMKTEKAYSEGRILAAVDPMHLRDKTAALDESIVDMAQLLASGVDASLHICHAWSLGDRGEIDLRLRRLAERARVRPDRVHLEWGEPADIVTRCAQSLDADIVVMGAVSRSALERMLIGYTAERVLDAVDCDVLIVKPPDFPRE
jgi:universal stress protein E